MALKIDQQNIYLCQYIIKKNLMIELIIHIRSTYTKLVPCCVRNSHRRE